MTEPDLSPAGASPAPAKTHGWAISLRYLGRTVADRSLRGADPVILGEDPACTVVVPGLGDAVALTLADHVQVVPGLTGTRIHDGAATPIDGPVRLVPGDRAELSRRVEAADIRRFTELSGDRNPLHYDERAARASRFGEIIVQGGVTSAILNAVVAEALGLALPHSALAPSGEPVWAVPATGGITTVDDRVRGLQSHERSHDVVAPGRRVALWAHDLHALRLPARAIIMLGSETHGLAPALQQLADETVRIPGTGNLDSLNVACACSVLLSEYWRAHPRTAAPA